MMQDYAMLFNSTAGSGRNGDVGGDPWGYNPVNAILRFTITILAPLLSPGIAPRYSKGQPAFPS